MTVAGILVAMISVVGRELLIAAGMVAVQVRVGVRT
jgi:hypothetical protein